MKNTSLRMKILSGMLCTGIALSSSSVSFAAVTQRGSLDEKLASSIEFRAEVDKEKEKGIRNEEMNDTLEIVINDSVKSNIITKTEGDKVLEYAKVKFQKECGDNQKCKRQGDHEKGGLFNELVTANILTKEKADILKEKMYHQKTAMRAEELQKGLNILVVNKVLTIEQKDKVKEAIMERDAQHKKNYQKMKGMTRKEIKDHMKKIKKTNVNPMKVLIDNGTITKDQEKEIEKVLPHYKHGHHGYHYDHKGK